MKKRFQPPFSVSLMVKWLVEGYTEMFCKNASTSAFPFADSYIKIGEPLSLTDGLYDFYGDLSKSDMKLFRSAVASAFGEFSKDNKSFPIIKSILQLAGMIGAVEILPILSDRLRYRKFLDCAVMAGENICGDIIFAIAPLAPHGGKTFLQCLNAIRKSPHYSKKSDSLLEVN